MARDTARYGRFRNSPRWKNGPRGLGGSRGFTIMAATLPSTPSARAITRIVQPQPTECQCLDLTRTYFAAEDGR